MVGDLVAVDMAREHVRRGRTEGDDVEVQRRHRRLWELVDRAPATEITVDLVAREVRAGDLVAPFQVDDYGRWRLLEGLDDIGLTLQHEPEITAFEATREAWRPRTLPAKHLPSVEIKAARPAGVPVELGAARTA